MRILPFSEFWARNSRYDTPVGALILHWIFTALVIVASVFTWYLRYVGLFTDAGPIAPNYTKNDEAYNLVANLFTYGHTWVGSKSFPPVKLRTPPSLALTTQLRSLRCNWAGNSNPPLIRKIPGVGAQNHRQKAALLVCRHIHHSQYLYNNSDLVAAQDHHSVRGHARCRDQRARFRDSLLVRVRQVAAGVGL